MTKAINLTDAKIAGLKPPSEGQVEHSDAKVPGLRVRVGKTGARTFIVRKRVNGKMRNFTIGRYGPRLGLAAARRAARTLLSDIDAGVEPTRSLTIAKRTKETIDDLWPAYRKTKAHLRSIGEIERIFERYILPKLGDRMADAVTRGEVTALIDEIASTAPVMARAVHSQLRAFYSWAMSRLDRLQANPCSEAGRPSAPKARDRVLNEDELRALWDYAKQQPFPWSQAIKLLILTGQRRSEIFEANRAEFDIAASSWTIPAERAKNDTEHVVALAPIARDMIAALPIIGNSPKLFPAVGNPLAGPSGISKVVDRARAYVEGQLGPRQRWTLHDIRRTVATGMQRLGVRMEVTEAVLNHVSGSRGGIAGVYQRYDYRTEKREALELWAKDVARIVEAPTFDA